METKEKLIEAAGQCLLEKGSHATSVKAVSALAGVNHGLVHHYFGSKEGLFIALMNKHFETVKPSLSFALKSEEELIQYLINTIISNSKMMIELRALSFHMPELNKELISKLILMRKRIIEILDIDEEQALLLQGAVYGLGFHASLDTSIDIEKHVKKVIGFIIEN